MIRQDVQSMHAYAVQDSAGLVKLDAMENPYRLPTALQRELGERLGRGRAEPLSGATARPTLHRARWRRMSSCRPAAS